MLRRFCDKNRVIEESKCTRVSVGVNVYMRNRLTDKKLLTCYSNTLSGDKCFKCPYGLYETRTCDCTDILALSVIKSACKITDLHAVELYITCYDHEIEDYTDLILSNKKFVKLLLALDLDSIYVLIGDEMYIHYKRKDLENILKV